MSLQRVLVYGGKGSLGSSVVSHFKTKGWWVCSIDLKSNDCADANVLVDASSDWCKQEVQVREGLASQIQQNKIEAVLNLAGGWAGGSAKSPNFIKHSDLMWKQSVWSSAIASSIAVHHLKPGGCLVLTGAKSGMAPTPGMLGYGMSKAAVHHLVKSMAHAKSGLPEGAICLGLLPVTLDTPANRQTMPKADPSNWTSLDFVAELLWKWSNGIDRPISGSLVELVSKNNETEIVCDT